MTEIRIKCCFCGHSKQNHKLIFDEEGITLECLVCLNLPRAYGGICVDVPAEPAEGEA